MNRVQYLIFDLYRTNLLSLKMMTIKRLII